MLEIVSNAVDPNDPTLAAFLDPYELAKQVKLFSSAHWHWSSSQGVQIRVLKWHKGSRCTFAIEIHTESGTHELIGKVYAKERPEVYQAMVELQRAGFDRTAEFSIPEPLTYVTSLRLLLEEKVQGNSVKEIFLNGSHGMQAEAAKRSARWLARFHECAPHSGEISELSKQLAKMRCWNEKFAFLAGPIAEEADTLFKKLGAASAALGDEARCAGHCSYSPDHVFLTDRGTVTIDWDGFDAGDPARDVARFIVATQRLALGRLRSISSLDSVTDIFLKAYVSARGPGILQRLPFHRAATCLRLAKYSAFHHRVPRWEKKVASMLDEGLRVLAG